MHHQGRQVGNRIYYGNYRGGVCSSQNRNRCLLILFTILLLLSGFIVTIIGFTHEPFWSESDASWCSFCKEDRETTLRNTANCRIAGPIVLGLGVLLLIFTICYSKKIQNNPSTQGAVTMTTAPTTLSYGPANTTTGTTTIHPPSGQHQPSQPYPTSQYAPNPQPPSQPYPPPSQYPPVPPSQPYPPSQYPPQFSYPPPSAPEMPPPPSYNDATGKN